MYKFKPFSLFDRNSRRYPVVSGGFLFITSDNNNLYAYDRKFPGIWSYNLSKNLWIELISLKNYLLPSPDDKIIGIIKEDDFIKIFSINKSTDEAKTRLHVCNLDTKEVVEKNLNGFLPDSKCFCQMNIFDYNNYYYTVVCIETEIDNLFNLDIYRLNLETYSWECAYKSDLLDECNPTIDSTIGIVYNDCKIYLFISNSLCDVRMFDLKTNCWDVVFSHWYFRNALVGKPHPWEKDSFSMSKYVDPDSNDTCLIVSSGENFNTFNADSEIWRLNLTSFKWEYFGEFGDLTYQCFFRRWASITPNGKLVTCDESSDYRKSRYVFSRKVYSAWTRIPTLTDICWDAVLHYYPDLPNRSKDEVEVKFGIPWKFLQSRIK